MGVLLINCADKMQPGDTERFLKFNGQLTGEARNGPSGSKGVSSKMLVRNNMSRNGGNPSKGVLIPRSVSKLVEGEKPVNHANRVSVDMRMSNRRRENESYSIFGNVTSHSLLVDRLCPWKSNKRLFTDGVSYFEQDNTQCCKVCTPSSFERTLLEKPGELGECDILKLPYDYRRWAYQGKGKFIPSFLKYVIFSTTARRFYYHSVTPQVFRNRHILSFLSLKFYEESGKNGARPSLSNGVADAEKSEEKILKVWTKQLLKQYRSVAASMTGCVVFLFGWLLLKFLNRVYSKVIVSHAHIVRLTKIQKENEDKKIPMIYLPLHKSHVDYLLISMVLWQYGLRWPHIIAGNNLKMPGFGWLLSRMGAIFIHRGSSAKPTAKARPSLLQMILRTRNPSSQAAKDPSHQDPLAMTRQQDDSLQYSCYLSVLKAYIEELLSLGWPLEVFIEGGRSRSGKPIADPKIGIMSSIVESLDCNKLEDAILVPVAISYDKVMDMASFHDEWQGLPKQTETVWKTIKGVCKHLTLKCGTVRVNFGQPFSAKEMIAFLNSSEKSLSPLESSNAADTISGVQSLGVPGAVESTSNSFTMSSQLSIPDFRSCQGDSFSSKLEMEEGRTPTSKSVVDQMARHSLFLCQKAGSVMSTHLVAFVLMNSHRDGTSLKNLIASVATLIQDISKGVLYPPMSLGFSGTPEQAVFYFNWLFPNAIILSDESHNLRTVDRSEWAQVTVRPNFDFTNCVPIFEMMYLSNHVACHLVPEAVLSTVLLTSAKLTRDTITAVNYNVFVSRQKLLEDCSTLSMLLSEEFFLASPCENLDLMFANLLSHFEVCELVFTEKDSDLTVSQCEKARQNRIAAEYDFSDDSDLSDYSSDDENDIVVSVKDTYMSNKSEKLITADDRIYLNLEDKQSKMKLKTFAFILGPVVESYWVVALNLDCLLKQDVCYDTFLKQCLTHLKNRMEEKTLKFPESSCFELVKNAVKFLLSFSVLRTYIALDALSYVTLTDFYKDSDSLIGLQNMFVQFKL